MYWEEDLERLALHKAALQRSIARNRAECAIAAGQVSRPVVLLDRAVAIWRRLPRLVKASAVPLGLFATRTAFRRRGILGSLVRWVPLAITVARAVGFAAIGRPNQRPLVRQHRRGSTGLPRRSSTERAEGG